MIKFIIRIFLFWISPPENQIAWIVPPIYNLNLMIKNSVDAVNMDWIL